MDGPGLTDILLGLLPMLLLIGAWYFFMRRYSGPNSHQARILEQCRRQTEALERIAKAIEERR